MSQAAAAYQFDFSGGDLSLDFVNTVGDRPIRQEEHLHAWRDLVDWAEQAGLVSKRTAASLRAAEGRGDTTRRAFARAVALRECLYRIFQAIAAGRAPARTDLDALNDAIRHAMVHARLEPRGGDYVWAFVDDDQTMDGFLRPVVRAAAELLVSPARVSVRECASDRCSWLFVDRSPTQRRRWCSMKTCGNRDKVRRFYERQRLEDK
jgi:predicted RNA-binding Zn ribbon-like protein